MHLVPKSYAPINALSGKRLSSGPASGSRNLSKGGVAMADTVEAEGQARPRAVVELSERVRITKTLENKIMKIVTTPKNDAQSWKLKYDDTS